MTYCTVLGAAGFIGNHLTARLLEDGHHVRVVDFAEPDMPCRKLAWQLADDMLTLDLRDPDAAAIAVEGSEWVFHLAANHGGVGFFGRHDYRPFFDNMRISLNVLDGCEQTGVGRMFYASSACVYPVDRQTLDSDRQLAEDSIEFGHPDLMYGREKLMTLRLCERAPFDARVGILNTVFGPGLRLEGERMKFPAAVVTRAIDAVESGEPLTVWGDGSQVRAYLHVGDAIDKILTMMTADYICPVNVTGTEPISCDDFARMVLDVLGARDHPIRHVDGPTGPENRRISNAGWVQSYGADRQRPLRDAVADFVLWVQDQR